MSLDLRVLCNRPEAQQFVIFVNSGRIADQGKLFTDLFPVAWKVLTFSSVNRGNTEIRVDFYQERKHQRRDLD
jgi:hypothetical protein